TKTGYHWRAAHGRHQSLRSACLLSQWPLHAVGQPVLSRRRSRLGREGRRHEERYGDRLEVLSRGRRDAYAPDAPGRRRCVFGLLLLLLKTRPMWTIMLLLGAYHGINPGMGWLFAVALGMQQGSARGVWRALPPIALGHALAVGVVLFAAGLAQLVVPLGLLQVM